jgi:hypothetical protein
MKAQEQSKADETRICLAHYAKISGNLTSKQHMVTKGGRHESCSVSSSLFFSLRVVAQLSSLKRQS